jgi:multiple sugar transport system permease protein
MSDPRKAVRWLAYPALLAISVILFVPWVLTLALSFFDWDFTGSPHFIGLKNYQSVLLDSRFNSSVWRTFLYASGATVLPLGLGLVAALVFARDFFGRQALRLVFSFPMLATPVSVALIWVMMLHPQSGVLNYLLSLVGIPPSQWIYSQNTVIATLVVIETWQWTPFVALILIGGLTTIPEELYEAASIDGATTWQAFAKITLPFLTPYLFVAGILRAVDAIKSLDLIFVMTSGGPGTASETINMYLYLNAFAYYNIGYASAISILFLGIVFILALGLVWLKGRQSASVPT